MIEINWQRYYELCKKPKVKMTKEEWEFYTYMYNLEEFRAGLDGD